MIPKCTIIIATEGYFVKRRILCAKTHIVLQILPFFFDVSGIHGNLVLHNNFFTARTTQHYRHSQQKPDRRVYSCCRRQANNWYMVVMVMNTRSSCSHCCPVTFHRAKIHVQERRPDIIYQTFSECQLLSIFTVPLQWIDRFHIEAENHMLPVRLKISVLKSLTGLVCAFELPGRFFSA